MSLYNDPDRARLVATLAYMKNHIFRLRSRGWTDSPYKNGAEGAALAHRDYSMWLDGESRDPKQRLAEFDDWLDAHMTEREIKRIRAGIRQRIRRDMGGGGRTVSLTDRAYDILTLYAEHHGGVTLSDVVERELGRGRKYRELKRDAAQKAQGERAAQQEDLA